MVKATYGSDLFSNYLRPGDLFLVRRGSDKSLSEVLNGQLANTGAHAESFHSIGPEELVAEERLDNGRDPGWRQTLVTRVRGRNYIPRRLAPVVPAPPW